MAQLAGTRYPTEFAGGNQVVSVLCTGGTNTNTVEFTNLTTIRGVSAVLAAAPTANAALIACTVSGNIVTVREYTAQGTLTTQTALDFYLTVVGEY
jgi:hypothetical protein